MADEDWYSLLDYVQRFLGFKGLVLISPARPQHSAHILTRPVLQQ